MKPLAGLFVAAIQAGRGRALPLLLLVVGALVLSGLEGTPLLTVREALFDPERVPASQSSSSASTARAWSNTVNGPGRATWSPN